MAKNHVLILVVHLPDRKSTVPIPRSTVHNPRNAFPNLRGTVPNPTTVS